MSNVVKQSEVTVLDKLKRETIRLELEKALCLGDLRQTKQRFEAILRKYGLGEDYVNILLNTPVRHIAKALRPEDKRKIIEDQKKMNACLPINN